MEKKLKVNYALVFFVVTIGLVLLGNLFELFTWQIWSRGLILFALVVLVNVLFKKYSRVSWVYKTSQVIIVAATLLFITLSTRQPDYLANPHDTKMSETVYQESTELKNDYYFGIEKKQINAKIGHNFYRITDSEEDSYYFKVHPPKPSNTDISVSHKKNINTLEIHLDSTNYRLPFLQEFFEQYPTLVLGKPHLRSDMNLNVSNNAFVEIELDEQRVDNFTGFFESGYSKITFSEESMPRKKLNITSQGGEIELLIPKELTNSINYNVKKDGQLFIEDERLLDKGTYTFISKKEKDTTEIIIYIDEGKVKIKVH